MCCRYLHDSPVKLCSVDNTRGGGDPFFLAIKVAWVTESNAALSPEFPSFQRVAFDAFEASCLPVLGWSLYTCGPVCLPAPRCAQQRRRGGISKSPTVRKWPSILPAQAAFHNVCVMIMTCKVCLHAHHSVTHTGNYTQTEDLLNPVRLKLHF